VSLTSAAASGDQLKALIELRDDLANRMEICGSDQNYSVMARVFTDTLDKIQKLEATATGAKGTALDELAKRRAAAGRPDSTSATRATRSS
jgi:hypothetical protein